jgi:hypothetical protein
MNVLFFCPSPEKSNAGQILGILHSAEIADLSIDTIDENSTSFSLGDESFDVVIIVYTPAVEFSTTLFEIVRYIDQKRPSGRFIFLPKTGGKEIIPSIFHPIRTLQLRLFYYPLSGQPLNLLDAHLAAFKEQWKKFSEPIPVEKSGKRSKKGRYNQVGFGLVLIVSILILFLVGLISVIVPIAGRSILSPTPTSLRPPAVAAFWLQESFESLDTTTRWQEQHYYTGRQAIQTTFSSSGLRLSASPLVTEAAFRLDSQQSWPLDELQSLSFSFAVSAMDDPAVNTVLAFGLYLNEDNLYRLDCLIIPAETDGRIQCQVQSPAQVEALSEAIPFSLDEKHIAILVFDPLTYSLQFFLDDQYYGQRAIQAVEYWRTREFKLQVRTEVQNLSSGSFSCDLYKLSLTHQP